MSSTVVLVPCSAGKVDHPAAAGELYTGSLHRMARAAAGAWPGAEVLVVSGRYGFLRLDDVVEPYEQRIDGPGAITPAELRRQAAELIGDRTVVALLPSAYSAAVISAGILPSSLPLAGSRGIGEQRGRLSRLARLAAARPAVAEAALEALVYWCPEAELGYRPTPLDVAELAEYAVAAVRDDFTGSAHVRDLSRRSHLGAGCTAALVLSVAIDAARAIAAGEPVPALRRSEFLDRRRAELAAIPAPAEQLSLAL